MIHLNETMNVAIELIQKIKEKPESLVTLFDERIQFVFQIGRKLKNAGILRVKRGPNGGYYRPFTDKTSLYEVYKALNKENIPDTLVGKAVKQTLKDIWI